MEKVRDIFRDSAKRMAEIIQDEGRVLGALAAAGLDQIMVSNASTMVWADPPSVVLSFWGDEDGSLFREAAQKLTHAAGKATKGFDETQKELTFSATIHGVEITLKATPPSTCTVEKIEEEVEVPEKITPAHTEKKVRYVLKGDCDPLMAPKEPDVTTQLDASGLNQIDQTINGAVDAASDVGV